MATIRDLRDRIIVLRLLREGIDTSNATGRMVAGVLASLAELELGWAANGVLPHARRVGHAGSTLGVPGRIISRNLLWLSACTRAVSLRARLRLLSA